MGQGAERVMGHSPAAIPECFCARRNVSVSTDARVSRPKERARKSIAIATLRFRLQCQPLLTISPLSRSPYHNQPRPQPIGSQFHPSFDRNLDWTRGIKPCTIPSVTGSYTDSLIHTSSTRSLACWLAVLVLLRARMRVMFSCD